ncbi:hypothetical protein C2U72_22120 [Prosthecomicrobium hirschii]|uniref:ImmA/IrrE family metallo-endopeptidase n=1 Tax=Prosthecodimorpha hirschii TaxID=665126 RepID=UPI00112CE466|nr:ImmA/IrrE family metallo-endopeptidase [Prosthecomicrobium hirschii]TPQ48753.1 hypothetical protein C2U72_22120 [Prosthecomicrobium hirschii]
MNIRPIRSEIDYDTALDRVAALMDAAPESLDADELDVLTTLIERYEADHHRIDAPSPTEAIRFRMEQGGLKPKDLEPILGSRSRVSEILRGLRPLTVDMVRSLNRHLGIPLESLVAPSASPSRTGSGRRPGKTVQWLVERGLMRDGDALDQFVASAFGGSASPVLFRRGAASRTNPQSDPLALQAWCAAVIHQAGRTGCAPLSAPRPTERDLREIARLSCQHDGPARVGGALAGLGIALVVLPHLPGTRLDGAALLGPAEAPIVGLTLRYDRIDNFWFTLMHELAHIRLHLSPDRRMILDDLSLPDADAIEREADELATNSLIPPHIWTAGKIGPTAKARDMIEVAIAAGVHPAIAAGRWQRQHGDYRTFSKLVGHGGVRRHFEGFAERQ